MDWTEFDPKKIADEGVRQAIVYLLNMVESQQEELVRLRLENERLQAENNRLKGQAKRPKIAAKGSSEEEEKKEEERDYSSEAERKEEEREQKKKKKRKKNEGIKIDREEVVRVPRAELPADAEFKGYEEVIVQDIQVKTDNIRFRKEKYYSASEGQSYLAELPVGYEGQFGPGLKAWVVVLSFALNVTEGKIKGFLEAGGISISSGQISRILSQEIAKLEPEKTAIYEAGLKSTTWQQIDDTGNKINGERCYTQVVCNPYHTTYFTTPKKDRLTVLQVLWGGQALLFCLDDMAWAYLAECGLPQKYQTILASWPQETMFTQAEFEERLQTELPGLGPQQYKWVLEAGGIAAYHRQETWPVIEQLVCDDAGQFKRIVKQEVLCWVHEGRHYKKLTPIIPYHQQLHLDFLAQFWSFYRALRLYAKQPDPDQMKILSQQFDNLFETKTGYQALDERIALTKAKKANLLMVLDYPHLPLHNNEAELGARQLKPKLNISFGPRTSKGAKAWDTGMTLVATAKKLGVNVFLYLHDRVSKQYLMPSLAELIATTSQFPP